MKHLKLIIHFKSTLINKIAFGINLETIDDNYKLIYAMRKIPNVVANLLDPLYRVNIMEII
jgi:hypothetical protein